MVLPSQASDEWLREAVLSRGRFSSRARFNYRVLRWIGYFRPELNVWVEVKSTVTKNRYCFFLEKA